MRRLLYALSAATAVTALSLLVWSTTGCSTGNAPIVSPGSTTNTGALAAGGASSVYVIQEPTGATNTVLQYSLTTSGALNPTATLTLPASFVAGALTTDTAGNLYIGGVLGATPEILVYAAGSTGTGTLTTTITAVNGSFTNPGSMYVDAAGNLYVADATAEVAVYAAGASGAATPTRLITGAATLLTNPYGITADAAGNVYVTTVPSSGVGGSLLEFAATANGNTAPVKDIVGNGVEIFVGVAVDPSGNIYANADDGTASSAGELVEFAAATTTNAPSLVLTNGYQFGGGLRRDAAGNLYSVQLTLSTGTPYLLAYSPTATGSTQPGLNFNSTAWTAPNSELAIH